MKIKLLNLLNKILKKFAFLGIFSFTTSASAQTIYQCLPCPDGTTSNPGAVGAGSCFSVTNKKGTKVFDSASSSSATLQPGWYRVTLKTKAGAKGKSLSASGAVDSGDCVIPGDYSYSGTTIGNWTLYSCAATGGAGGAADVLAYVIYIANTSTVTYKKTDNSPYLEIKNNTTGKKRVFSETTKATDGTDAYAFRPNTSYPSCTYGSNTFYMTCTAGTAGTDSVASVTGTESKDKSSGTVDGLPGGDFGVIITRL